MLRLQQQIRHNISAQASSNCIKEYFLSEPILYGNKRNQTREHSLASKQDIYLRNGQVKTGILKLREHADKRQGKIKAKGKQSYPLH